MTEPEPPRPGAALVLARTALAALLGAVGAWTSTLVLDRAWPGVVLLLVLAVAVPWRCSPGTPCLRVLGFAGTLVALAERLARGLGVPAGEGQPDPFRRLAVSPQGSTLDPGFLDAVVGFGDLTVGRIMTPRTDLVMLPLDAPWGEILETVRRTAVSRIPVWGRDRDDIVGLLLAKDLLRFLGQPPPSPRVLQRILHPALFVPIFRSADDCLADLKKRHVHAALVVDEHGALAGLVSLDDLLGELLGEVLDETDAEEVAEVRQQEDGSLLVQAGIDIEDFAEATGVHLPEGEYATLGGFVISRTHTLPRRGQMVEWDGLSLEVVGVVRRRITEVRVRSLSVEESS
ncbi:MAG: CBS domain-containing protein [Deltaproteobacteria bacterium]|nr:CBS domain-containing protein [Deltaproteobacteria bacterium]